MRKGQKELKDQINQAIKTIRSNGTYNTIAKKYFDFDPTARIKLLHSATARCSVCPAAGSVGLGKACVRISDYYLSILEGALLHLLRCFWLFSFGLHRLGPLGRDGQAHRAKSLWVWGVNALHHGGARHP